MPTFDGENLLIILDSGVTTVNAEIDLYSDWKEWALTGDNVKYPPAFRTIGGDPLSTTINAGSYFFLQNQYGWRIRPPEEDISIEIIGNLVAEDSNLDIITPTLGNFTVLVVGLQAVTQGVNQQGIGEAVAPAVWQVPVGTPTAGTYGDLVKDIQDSLTSLAATIIAADLTIASGSTTTQIRTGATQVDGFYDGLICVIMNAAGIVARTITSYENSNGAFNLDIALPFTPGIGNRFVVLGRVASAAASVDNNAIAIAVWARSIAAATVGSYGELCNKVKTNTGLIPALL